MVATMVIMSDLFFHQYSSQDAVPEHEEADSVQSLLWM